MLSKLRSNEKERKNVNKKLVEYLLKKDFSRLDTTNASPLTSKLPKTYRKVRVKRTQWYNNPLYKEIRNSDYNTEDETASRNSTISIKSCSKSIASFDSGFKSDNDDYTGNVTKMERDRFLHSFPKQDFREVSSELLKTFRDFENYDDRSLQNTLEAMEKLLNM